MIYVTSDLHLGHNKEFLYKVRGYNTISEMNTAILTNWNNLVSSDDEVYILGDIMLGDNVEGLNLVKQLNGNLHIIWGNHDTDARKCLFEDLDNVVEVGYATLVKYKKYHFFMSHYPSITGNLEKESLHLMTLNLFGHTHSKEKFYNNLFYMYNVAMDAHNCTPISLDQVIEELKIKFLETII